MESANLIKSKVLYLRNSFPAVKKMVIKKLQLVRQVFNHF